MEKLIVFGELWHCQAAATGFEGDVRISEVVSADDDCNRLTERTPNSKGTENSKPMRAGAR